MPAPTLDTILARLRAHRDDYRRDYGVARLAIFGSYARGEQREDSDLDVLVELERPIGLFRFAALERDLSSLVGVPVDLVTPKALKPAIGATIYRELLRVE